MLCTHFGAGSGFDCAVFKICTVCCSLVRSTFVKNVGPDGVLQKCSAEAIIMIPLIFVLRRRRSKTLSSSIFGSENRRTPLYLQSSIFGAEDRRTPLIFDLRPRRMGRRSDERRGGGTSSSEERRTPHLPPSRPKNEEPPIFHLLGRKNGRRTPSLVLLLPPTPGHQLPSAILRSGSSDRSSPLKIGPKIEIGSYSALYSSFCPFLHLRPAACRPTPTRLRRVCVSDLTGSTRKANVICRIQNPDIPRAGLVGRTAGRGGGARQDGTPTEQIANETSVPRNPQCIEQNVS